MKTIKILKFLEYSKKRGKFVKIIEINKENANCGSQPNSNLPRSSKHFLEMRFPFAGILVFLG
jgi:hypothetical protein